jgi:hypothetical protein
LKASVPSSGAQPAWLPSLVAEVYSIAITLCFAVFAWRYDALLLIRCVLICFGISMVIHALMPRHLPVQQA